MKEKQANTPESENFDWKFQTLGDPQLEKMLVAVSRFASAMQRKINPHWLSLLGTSGAGKSHLAKAIRRFWKTEAGVWMLQGKAGKVEQLKDSRFISWRQFMNRQRKGEYEEIENIAQLPFVVIDDIGAEYDSPFAKSRVDEIIDRRVGKWTVFTANLSLEQIATRIDPRVSSRMLRGGSVVVEVDVPDFNLRNRHQN